MADNVEFHDFSIEVKNAIKQEAIAFLHEAAGELVSQVARNLDKEKGRWHTEQKAKWRYEVDESTLEATVGNPMERSLWTEFGTGTEAEGGKGRKGYWVYVKDDNSSAGSGGSYTYTGGKVYTLEEAKEVMAILQSQGLDAHITKGQKPKRPFRDAYTKMQPKIRKLAEERFKEIE